MNTNDKKSYFYSNKKVMSYNKNDFRWHFIISEKGFGKSQAQKIKRKEVIKMIKEKLIKDSINNILRLENYKLGLNDIGDLKDLKFLVNDLIKRKEVFKKHKLDWFKYDESDDLEEAIKYNIAVNCEQRLNGYYDDCFTELYDKEDWYEYIFNLMQEEWHQNGSIFVGDRILKFTKLYGHDNVKTLIKLWIDNYEDVKPYIK